MSKTSEFLAEVIRAANNLDKNDNIERKRLVEDAIVVIQHLRAIAGERTKPIASDPLFELQFISAAITIGWATDARVKMALLGAAVAIRDLSVMLHQNS